MTKLTSTSQRGSNFLEEHARSTDTSLWAVYGSHSTAKDRAFTWCCNRMTELNGSDLRIMSHNSFAFTCGFFANIDGITSLVVETASNEYFIPCTDN